MRALRWLGLTFLVACTTAQNTPIPAAWSVAETPKIRSLQVGDDGAVRTVGTVSLQAPEVRIEGGRLMRGDKALTEVFPAIESFDVSAARGEVVFSAKREKSGFDIGLVSLDGSPISWVPNDPADEVMVSWAPRGNKIAYVIRTGAGDFIRTVHVPTAAELTNDFPHARVHALAWSPNGERYAVAVSSAEGSDRIEVMKYGGEERKVAVPSQSKLPISADPFGPEALLLRPATLRYGEKLPLVVWQSDDRLGWDDARAALLQRARLAIVVTTKAPDDALWERIRGVEWVDQERTFVVLSGAPPASGTSDASAPLQFVADPSVVPGTYARRGRVIAAAPSVVKSVAAGFIADQLKGNPSPNGSSR